MKKVIILTFIFLGIINKIFPQKKIDLQKYSIDTLALLTNGLFLGDKNLHFKKELLNTHMDSTNLYTKYDSVYIFSLNGLPYKDEFAGDGDYINVFMADSNIRKLSSCIWMELYEIKLIKHSIILKIIRHEKINSVLTSSLLYEFNVTVGRNNSETLNDYYAPKYKLKAKRTITRVLR